MPTPTSRAKPLPDLLVEQGLVSREQLQRLQAEAARTGTPLKRLIVRQGLVTEEDMAALIAGQTGVMRLDLANYLIKPEVIQLVPEALARKHTLIPVFKIGDTLTVAIDDPLNFFAIDEVRLKAKCDVKTVIATERSIREALDQQYGSAGTVHAVAQAIRDAGAPQRDEAAAAEAPIIRLVNLLVTQAVKERASDIHIEPGDGILRTRFRVDGVLREVAGPPAALHSAVVSRVKVLAKLDIAEKRRPQDGRFRLKMDGGDIDLRVSVVPTQFGETVVLRLLDSRTALLSLAQLGLDEATSAQVERLVRAPHGLLLVTGPTGSGKTTTLYAALALINSTVRNILTIEDPVEYRLPGVNQVQVNPKADLTFASALRSFLRQDPDIIMVGEIRDRETADIAIQAALTGHLVFSTLHTNDAPSALTRLIEMGVEPFLVASSVMGVLAQRLVRLICPTCKRPASVAPQAAAELGLAAGASMSEGAGCPQCAQAGYKGRQGIFELLLMTPEIKNLVAAKAPAHALRAAALAASMRTLREDGLAKALAGATTVQEVLRVTQLDEEPA